MLGGPEPPIGLIDAMVLGLVEGLTEFLPVSSTGHLIVAGHLLGAHSATLEIGIQIGAISAILVLFWRRLWEALVGLPRARATGSPNLLLQIVLAALPAAIVGKMCDDWIEARLFTPAVVATTTLIGGVLLLWLERWLRGRPPGGAGELPAMGYRTAFWIGVWQCLALIPGTSRSGATIAGGLLLGLSRPAAAEFSFLVGLPILYGACLLKLGKNWAEVTGPLAVPFVIATLFAFLAALVVVRPFVAFLRRHTFVPFAIYRILAGALLALACARGWL